MYLKFYGLNEEPFRLTPDPRFVHLAETHRDVLTGMLESILQRKGLMVVAGPAGTGKTTLLNLLLNQLSSPEFTSRFISTAFVWNPLMTRAEMLEAILEEFEVSCQSSSKPRRLMALQEKMVETTRRGGTSVLLIDEAHLLTTELLEEIRLLSNSDSYREKLLQIILCGQPELLSAFERPELQSLRQRVVRVGRLRSLSLAETRAYLAQRLHAAGHQGHPIFAGAAIEQIHRKTQGIPRLINQLCDNCLTIGVTTGAKQIAADIVLEAFHSLGVAELSQAETERNAEESVRRKAEATVSSTLLGRAGTTPSIRLETPTTRTAMTILFEGIKPLRPASRE
jgi:general secretion pathway protein A